MPRCGICSEAYAASSPYRPFCSKRCQDVDLGRWFGGNYRIPSEEIPDEVELEIARRNQVND